MDNNKRLNILLITNLFPNKMEPNRGIFIKQAGFELAQLCNLHVVAPVPFFPFKSRFLQKWSMYAEIEKKEVIDGLEVYHPRWLIIPKILASAYGLSFFFCIYSLIKKIVINKKINLIYGQWVYPDGFAAVLLGKVFKKPVILQALGCDINLYSRYFLRRILITWSLKNCKKVIVVSKALKDKIIDLGIEKEKIVYIPNGIDSNLFHPLDKEECRKELQLSKDEKIILFIGSLESVKGVDTLIFAFEEFIKNINFKCCLVIIGKGSLLEFLRKLISKMGIAENVKFIGEVDHERIPIWLNASDLFCLPSIREGMPNVILEALACKKPLVSTRVGAIPDLLQEDDFYKLIKINSPKELCGSFQTIFHNLSTKEFKSANWKYQFTWEANSRAVLNVFKNFEN